MANKVVTNMAVGIPFVRPLHDRLLVERLPAETYRRIQLVGSYVDLHYPDVATQNSQRAKVLAVGTEVHDVKPGDEVLLPGIAAKYPDWESCDMMLIQVGDIGGIFG